MPEEFSKGKDLVGGSEKIGKRHSYPKIINWSEYFPGEVILEGTGKSKEIALTFDDGPDDIWTPKVLDELLRWHANTGTDGKNLHCHKKSDRL